MSKPVPRRARARADRGDLKGRVRIVCSIRHSQEVIKCGGECMDMCCAAPASS